MRQKIVEQDQNYPQWRIFKELDQGVPEVLAVAVLAFFVLLLVLLFAFNLPHLILQSLRRKAKN